MKRFIATILAVMMLLGLTACGNKIDTGMSGGAVIDNELLEPEVPDNELSEPEVPDNEHWEPDEVVLPEGSIGDLSNISSFEKSAYMTSNIGTCVATDGTYMYVADGLIHKYGSEGTVIDTFKDPAVKLAYVDGKLIYSTGASIRMMNVDGTEIREITNRNSSAAFCCQNGRVFFFEKIEGSLVNAGFLCSVNMDGSDFINYGELGAKFIYADSATVYVAYMDYAGGVHVYYYGFEDNDFHKAFNKPASEAVVYELNLDRIAANEKNIFFTTCSNNSELGIYMVGAGGRKRLVHKGFEQILCCGDRLYLANRDWVECYDLNTKELYDCQDTIYAKDAADSLMDVFGDYLFLAVNDMESSVRIRKIDR